jgi:hypothetical protein
LLAPSILITFPLPFHTRLNPYIIVVFSCYPFFICL